MGTSHTFTDKFFVRLQNPAEELDFALSNLIQTLNIRANFLPSNSFEFSIDNISSLDLKCVRDKSFMSNILEGREIIVKLDPKFVYIVSSLFSSSFINKGYCVGIDPKLYFPGTPFKISYILKLVEFGTNTIPPNRIYLPALYSCINFKENTDGYNLLRSRSFKLYKKYVSEHGVGISIRSV